MGQRRQSQGQGQRRPRTAGQGQRQGQQRRARQQEILSQVRRDLAGLQQFDYALQSTDIRGMEALRRFGAAGLMA